MGGRQRRMEKGRGARSRKVRYLCIHSCWGIEDVAIEVVGGRLGHFYQRCKYEGSGWASIT